MPRAKKHPKLSADERAFVNRLDCLNEEEIKQLTTREIFAYFKIIDKVDSRADVRRMVRTVWHPEVVPPRAKRKRYYYWSMQAQRFGAGGRD
jgi:hypothetical protein